MFELNDAAIEAIIFAMEDQEGKRRINLANGTVVIPEEGECPPELLPPPQWSSRDGFHLMEEFLKTVRNPSARHELGAALGRGRGVFKAFKEALVAFPDVERAFHDFKLKALRGVIRSWYDELRESQGLSRLGAEPEDTEDLVASDFGIELGQGPKLLRLVLDLVGAAEEEARDVLPVVVAASEAESLRTRLSESSDWICAYIPDGEGGAIAAAAALRERAGGRAYGRAVFLHVLPDFRRAGMGKALLAALLKLFAAEGHQLLVLDSAFLPQGFTDRLPSLGLSSFGCRGYFQP